MVQRCSIMLLKINPMNVLFVRTRESLSWQCRMQLKALMLLEKVKKENLSQLVYNVTSFSPSALEIDEIVKVGYPNAEISYEVNQSRQKIVDSWPADVDDEPARSIGVGKLGMTFLGHLKSIYCQP